MSSLELARRAADQALKVFPLPSVVLFPGSSLPLHIFEPRYRALVKAALASDRIMALGLLEPGWQGDYHGRPPLMRVVCAAEVVYATELPDGRFNIVVEGLARARVLEELPPSAEYRCIRAQLVEDPPSAAPTREEDVLRRALLELTTRLEESGQVQALLEVTGKARGGALADLVAGALIEDLEARSELLLETNPQARLELLLSHIGALLGKLGSTKSGLLH
jgi:uncharacterized protein